MTMEAQVTLDMIRIQLNWLEREMLALRQAIGHRSISEKPRSFESLRGIWQDITISDEDILKSRLTLPKDI